MTVDYDGFSAIRPIVNYFDIRWFERVKSIEVLEKLRDDEDSIAAIQRFPNATVSYIDEQSYFTRFANLNP